VVKALLGLGLRGPRKRVTAPAESCVIGPCSLLKAKKWQGSGPPDSTRDGSGTRPSGDRWTS